jgi:hypothetical protein
LPRKTKFFSAKEKPLAVLTTIFSKNFVFQTGKTMAKTMGSTCFARQATIFYACKI